jgi:hypothetical protein
MPNIFLPANLILDSWGRGRYPKYTPGLCWEQIPLNNPQTVSVTGIIVIIDCCLFKLLERATVG